MSPRAFISLAIVTGLALAAAAVTVALQRDDGAVNAYQGEPMFAALSERVNEVESVIVETPFYRAAFAHRGEAWVDTARGDYPARAETVTDMIAAFAAMTRIEPKTDNPDWYTYIGVGSPDAEGEARGTRVTAIATNGDELANMILGRASANVGYSRVGGTFVRDEGDARAWLAEGTVEVPGSIRGWFPMVLHVPGPEMARVSILIGDELVLDAEKTDFETGNYELVFLSEDLGPPEATANDDAVRGLTQGAVSVFLDDVRPRSEVVMAEDARTVRFVTRAGLHIDVGLGEADGETWVLFDVTAEAGSEAEAEVADIRARSENWGFKLPSNKISALTKALSELIVLPDAQPEIGPGAPLPQLPQPGP